jgi:hypothetical protein
LITVNSPFTLKKTFTVNSPLILKKAIHCKFALHPGKKHSLLIRPSPWKSNPRQKLENFRFRGRFMKKLKWGEDLSLNAAWPNLGCSVIEAFFSPFKKCASLGRALQVPKQSFVLNTGLWYQVQVLREQFKAYFRFQTKPSDVVHQNYVPRIRPNFVAH